MKSPESEEEQAARIAKTFMESARQEELNIKEQIRIVAVTLSNVDQQVRTAIQLVNQAHEKIEDMVAHKVYRDNSDPNININSHYNILDAFNDIVKTSSFLRMQLGVPLRRFLLLAEEQKVEEQNNPNKLPEIVEGSEDEQIKQEDLLNAFHESEKIMENSKGHFKGIANESEENDEEDRYSETGEREIEFIFNPNLGEEDSEEEDFEKSENKENSEDEETEED